METFIRRKNLKHYRNLLTATSDETVRVQLFKRIAEEERRQILQRISEQESGDLDWQRAKSPCGDLF